jgi:hypothetical protein
MAKTNKTTCCLRLYIVHYYSMTEAYLPLSTTYCTFVLQHLTLYGTFLTVVLGIDTNYGDANDLPRSHYIIYSSI